MKKCIVCGTPLEGEPLLVVKNLPASAQDLLSKDQLEGEKGLDLALCQCRKCGLVQFDCGPVHYYKDVIRAGGYSTTMRELRRSEYKHLIETYHLQGKKFIEIGCGRGEFISVLREFPVEVYGIEHSQALVDAARESGLNVWQNFAGGGAYDFGRSAV